VHVCIEYVCFIFASCLLHRVNGILDSSPNFTAAFLYNQCSCWHEDTDSVREVRVLRLRSKYGFSSLPTSGNSLKAPKTRFFSRKQSYAL